MSAAVMPIRSVPSAEALLASASESTVTTRKPMKRVMSLSSVLERLLGAHVGGCGPAAWLRLIDGRRRGGGRRRCEAFGYQVTARGVAWRDGVERGQRLEAYGLHVRASQRKGAARRQRGEVRRRAGNRD